MLGRFIERGCKKYKGRTEGRMRQRKLQTTSQSSKIKISNG